MKNLLALVAFGLSLAGCLTTQIINAQTYSIDSYQVAGGGGASTGGTYSVAGTIGQPAAGMASSGGGYSLIGGFWSQVTVLESAGGPTLFISRVGDHITVYWQAQNGWTLEENPTLNAPAGWTNSLEWVTVNGVSFHYVTNTVGASFFRLKR